MAPSAAIADDDTNGPPARPAWRRGRGRPNPPGERTGALPGPGARRKRGRPASLSHAARVRTSQQGAPPRHGAHRAKATQQPADPIRDPLVGAAHRRSRPTLVNARPAHLTADRGPAPAARPGMPTARPNGPPPRGGPPQREDPEELRPRRGPIVDPRRRPTPEEASAISARGTRGAVMTGKISELSRDRGFGFIVDNAGRKRFFHRSAVLNSGFDNLREGLQVQFEPRDDVKGLRAINVPAGDGRASTARRAVGSLGPRQSAAGRRSAAS